MPTKNCDILPKKIILTPHHGPQDPPSLALPTLQPRFSRPPHLVPSALVMLPCLLNLLSPPLGSCACFSHHLTAPPSRTCLTSSGSLLQNPSLATLSKLAPHTLSLPDLTAVRVSYMSQSFISLFVA